jgi:hypothetical protein
LVYLQNKHIQRFLRAANMRKKGMATHYMNNVAKIEQMYNTGLKNAKELNC